MTTKQEQYVTLAFRVAFPRAGKIAVAFHDFNETWIVAVNQMLGELEIYAMVVGSDDDEFRFTCLTDQSRPAITFPIPEDLDA